MPVANSGALSVVLAWCRVVPRIDRPAESAAPRESAARRRALRTGAGFRASVLEFRRRTVRQRSPAAAVHGRSATACEFTDCTGPKRSGAPNPARKCLELFAVPEFDLARVGIRRGCCG